jgi:hypothetical protein
MSYFYHFLFVWVDKMLYNSIDCLSWWHNYALLCVYQYWSRTFSILDRTAKYDRKKLSLKV